MNDNILVAEREFYMARHGQTNHNKAGLVSGHDAVLTEQGEEQARLLNQVLAQRFSPLDQCYFVVSDLVRAKHTHEIATNGAQVTIDTGLNERDNGILGGKALAYRVEKIKRWCLDHPSGRSLPNYRGVQTHSDHQRNVMNAVNRHLVECPRDKVPVFISHHGTMNRVAEVIGCNDIEFDNGGLYHFIPDSTTHRWAIEQVSLDNGRIIEKEVARSVPTFRAGYIEAGRRI